MKKLFIILAIVIAVAGALLWQRYGGLLRLYPAPVASPTIDISGLRVPDGFQLSVLRSGLMNARV
ncbi:MAG: hypothetical protein HYW56_00180, partial [Candidatus Harrisonbacteria bacterium]|nr:hypothetical protein [Candidatus Harrisonbacteria bacterium]